MSRMDLCNVHSIHTSFHQLSDEVVCLPFTAFIREEFASATVCSHAFTCYLAQHALVMHNLSEWSSIAWHDGSVSVQCVMLHLDQSNRIHCLICVNALCTSIYCVYVCCVHCTVYASSLSWPAECITQTDGTKCDNQHSDEYVCGAMIRLRFIFWYSTVKAATQPFNVLIFLFLFSLILYSQAFASRRSRYFLPILILFLVGNVDSICSKSLHKLKSAA